MDPGSTDQPLPPSTDALTVRVYGELRAMASTFLRRERDAHTLQTTALVHEAYLRIAQAEDLRILSPGLLRAPREEARGVPRNPSPSTRRSRRPKVAIPCATDQMN